MHFNANEKLGIIVDGANTHAAVRALGFDIDYKRLLEFGRQQGRLVRAEYYTAIVDEEGTDHVPLKPLVDWLQYNGWVVKTSVGRAFTDAAGRRRVRSPNVVELAVGLIRMARYVDHILLFSGAGDFCPAVQAVQEQGVRVTVVSTLKTQPTMVSDEMRRQADQFLDLDAEVREATERLMETRPPVRFEREVRSLSGAK